MRRRAFITRLLGALAAAPVIGKLTPVAWRPDDWRNDVIYNVSPVEAPYVQVTGPIEIYGSDFCEQHLVELQARPVMQLEGERASRAAAQMERRLQALLEEVYRIS